MKSASSPDVRLRAVYVSHNSVGDPLVRSQVLTYLRGLALRGVTADLVTFERGVPSFPVGEFPRERWHPIQARPGSGVPSKLSDLVRGTALVTRLARERNAKLIHARSYVAAAIAAVAGLLTGTPYVFDMRGFLAEEYVEGGHWRAGEFRVRLLQRAERWLLRRAAAVVVLTQVAAQRLRSEARYSTALRETPVTVIPCMVDLSRFRPMSRRAARPTLVFSGAVGLRNLIDEVLVVYALAREIDPDLQLLILNRGQHELIRRSLHAHGLVDATVDIRTADHSEMPALLAQADVGIALQRLGRSKGGASAVKVAEYLACALPVVMNAGHGDMSVLVERFGCGHVVGTYDPGSLRSAAHAVVSFARDEDARRRARALAEQMFDVRIGIDRYEQLYRTVASGVGSGSPTV